MFTNTSTGEEKQANWDENVGRAYLYWTPSNWLALKADYIYEYFKEGAEFSFGASKDKTQRVPLAANFFHPSGLGMTLKGTFVTQEGDFSTIVDQATFTHGKDDFWLFDAAINYRIPQRYGFLTVGVRNMCDRSFQYFDTDFKNPAIQQGRVFFAKATLSF